MASVSSLDKDLRKMRLDKYTPAAANEARSWIESILGERLPSGDLLEGLKDGVALCRLINLAIPPGVKFKKSAMPFVQMENISQFLRACQQPPLNLQDHDIFLTVDLYEAKDPAQVLQCLGAFSRAAHGVNPAVFPSAIGPKSGNRGSAMSPQGTGSATPAASMMSPRGRGISNASNGSSVYGTRTVLTPTKTGDSNSGRWSPTKSPTSTSVSSWSKREHEGATAPAWNIAQYGYMGGASQGNLGISFGGRRQITSAGPKVPSLAEKERLRKTEEDRQRQQMEIEEARRREIEAEEQRAKEEEERRWEEETRRAREEEKRRAEEEQRHWEEEERQWKITEENRRKEEEEAEARLAEERSQIRSKSDARLRGQFLSQYQAEQQEDTYSSRVKELEKELELARQREQAYERERQTRPARQDDSQSRARSRSRPKTAKVSSPPMRNDSWSRNEREFLQTQWNLQKQPNLQGTPEEAAQGPDTPPQQQQQQQQVRSPRPLPVPTASSTSIPGMIKTHRTGEKLPQPPQVKTHRTGEALPELPQVKKHHTGSRPLPNPAAYASPPPATSGGPSPATSARNNRFAEPSRGPFSPPTTTSAFSSPPPTGSKPFSPPTSSKNSAMSRTDRYLSSNPAPATPPTPQTYARELGATAERDAEDRRRQQSQQKTKAGGLAGKSLLEREMEMERQRQREWEEAQKETAAKAAGSSPAGGGQDGADAAGGGRWDVNQWTGYTGGDGQNRGGQGIGAGRRQIVGPRPLPGSR